MNLDTIEKNLDITNPILMEWVLKQIANKRKFDEQQANEIEEKLLTDESFVYIFKDDSLYVQSLLFSAASTERLARYIDQIIEKWPNLQTKSLIKATLVIAKTDAEKAFDLFMDYCSRNPFKDSFKCRGILKSLQYLSEDDAKAVFAQIDKAFMKSPVASDNGIDILINAKQLADRRFLILFERYMETFSISNEKDHLKKSLASLAPAIGGTEADCWHLFNLVEDAAYPMPHDMPGFFDSSFPFKEFKEMIKKLKVGDFHALETFSQNHSMLISDYENRYALDYLLTNKKLHNKLNDKHKRLCIAGLAASLFFTTGKISRIDTAGLTVEKVAEMFSAEMEETPVLDSVYEFLKTQDRDAVAAALTNAYYKNKDSIGAINILRLMGRLRYEAFLKPLAEACMIDFKMEYYFEELEQYVLQYQDKAVTLLKEYWPDMDMGERILAIDMAANIGGEKGLDFIDTYFDFYWQEEKEILLNAVQDVCDPRYLEKLKPFIDKNQAMIDKAYAVVSLLHYGMTPETEKILPSVKQGREKQKKVMEMFSKGNKFEDLDETVVRAELRCTKCKDTFDYYLNNVIIDESREPFIAEEITCLKCGAVDEMTFTNKGKLAITGSILRSALIAQKDRDALNKSAVQRMSFGAFGQKVGILKGIEQYEKKIEEHPGNGDFYIGLGNIYLNTNHFRKAKKYFQKAVELDSSYIQAHHALARIEEEITGNLNTALNILQTGKIHLTAPKFYQPPGDQVDQMTLSRIYCDYHNDLLIKTGRNDPIIHPPSSIIKKKKVGRNEPCPCGSRKKYKKCCLNK